MYTVVIVRLLGAIKGDVSLLTLACSSQGKQVLGFRVKLCRLMWEIYAISVLLAFLVNVSNVKGIKILI